MGFKERTDAFDFNVALQDFAKRMDRKAHPEPAPAELPKVDYSLKKGEKMKIKLNINKK